MGGYGNTPLGTFLAPLRVHTKAGCVTFLRFCSGKWLLSSQQNVKHNYVLELTVA